MTFDLAIQIVQWFIKMAPWLSKLTGLQRLYARLKLRVPLNAYRHLHKELIHKLREIDINAQDPEHAAVLCSRIASNYLDAACEMIAYTLSEPRDTHKLCGCIKLFVSDDQVRLATWIRSKNSDGRPVRLDFSGATGNSVFAALTGHSDGKTHWPKLRCFACGDLCSQPRYVNSRGNDYKLWYRSVLVFPIRLDHDTIIGFLAFDSPKVNFFGRLPCPYDFIDKPTDYHDELEECALYHIGGIISDTLAIVLSRMQTNLIDHVTTTGESENEGK
ncbi:MAG: hypothetical protein JJU36_14760 [Phycisphaeraceae bacterium]|nr:hypothetical protein [Phycisphaeraceae bacterium]